MALALGLGPQLVPVGPRAMAQAPAGRGPSAQAALVQGLVTALMRDPFALEPLEALRRTLGNSTRLVVVAQQLTQLATRVPQPFPVHVVAARLYEAAGNREANLQQLRAAAQRAPRQPRALAGLGAYSEALGEHEIAASAYESLAAVEPRPAEANAAALKAAKHYLARGTQPDLARALGLWHAHGPAAPIDERLRFADALIQRGLRKEAARELEQLGALRGADKVAVAVAALRRLSEVRAQLGDARGGAGALLQALRVAPPAGRAELLPLVVAAYQRARALPELARAAPGVLGQSAAALMLAGDAWLASGDTGRALAAYRQAAQHAPGDVEVRLRLATASKDAAEIIVQREKVVALAPDEPTYRLELARALFQAKRNPEAEAALASAAQRFVQSPSVQFEIASLLRDKIGCQQALGPMNRAIELDPEDDTFQNALAECQWKLGKKAEASAALWKYADAQKSVARYRRLVDFFGARKEWPEVEKAYAGWVVVSPSDLDARRQYALLLERLGKLDQAVAEWKVVDKTATEPFMRNQAGHKLRNLGNAILLRNAEDSEPRKRKR
jgi:thioredoxin-like negative regulator of GroEL